MKTKYKITYQDKGTVKSIVIVTDDIDEESLPSNIIEIQKSDVSFEFNYFKKIKDKDLKNTLYELSLMLNSKILLDDALDILIKNEKKVLMREFLKSLKMSFSNSIDIGRNFDSFKINPLVKSFFKITQDSGNVALNINSLTTIITERYETKKEFVKSMTYPIILCITFFIALIGIFKFVVPNFESIFENSKMELPLATKLLLATKDVFDNYLFLIIICFFIICLGILFLYKSSTKLRESIDRIFVKNLFIFSDLYRIKNLYTYFVVVDILLQSKYEFFDSISKSKVLINNKYLLAKITEIENLLKSGKSVSYAFESTKLFDDVTLNLINTGEFTNSLDDVICEIKKIYKRRFDDKLKFFSLLIEPLFFIIIMALIVWIILAIFVPLWSMSDML